MENIKVSIIVPIYNAEKFVEGCIISLINQTLQEIEIICINDGSKDGSLHKLENLKEKYPDRIKVISTKNQGVWRARKVGISIAKGEYIAFCDSDDIVEAEMYQSLYANVKKEDAEMGVCAFQRIDALSNRTISTEMSSFGTSTINVEEQPYILTIINTSLWNKIIKKVVLDKVIELEYPPRVVEDAIFLASIYPKIKKIAFVKEPLYKYYVRTGTAMTYVKKSELSGIIENMRFTRNYVEKLYGKNVTEIVDIMAFIHIGISMPLHMMGEEKGALCKVIKDIKTVMRYDFPLYKRMNIHRVGLKNLKHYYKPLFARCFFDRKGYFVMLWLYNEITTKLKVEMKW